MRRGKPHPSLPRCAVEGTVGRYDKGLSRTNPLDLRLSKRRPPNSYFLVSFCRERTSRGGLSLLPVWVHETSPTKMSPLELMHTPWGAMKVPGSSPSGTSPSLAR